MKKILQLLLVISICVCFVIFLQGTDIGESVRLVKQLGVYSLLILVATFFAYLAGTLGWRYCIDSTAIPSLLQLFAIRHVGNTITLFNPTGVIAGELYNARMLMNNGIEEKSAYQSVLLGRILMTLSQLVLLVVLLIWFILYLSARVSSDIMYLVYLGFFVVLLIISIILFVLLKKGKDRKVSVTEKKCQKIIFHISEMRSLLVRYIRKRPGETAIAFSMYTVQWILSSLELFFILYFLNYRVTIWDGLFLDTLIIVMKSTVAFIPGQLGVEELINKFVLYLFGISSPDLWLSVSILRRARQLFWSGIAVLLYMRQKKIKSTVKVHGSIVRKS
jgi:hypothetical protein